MKNTMVRFCLLGAAVSLAPVILLAQYPTTGTPQTVGPSQASYTPAVAGATSGPFGSDSSANGSAGTDARLMQDKIFVRKLSESSVAKAQFGQLAAQKASNDDVKKFGQKMLDDHADLDKDVQPVADQLGVRSAKKMSKADQDEFDKLNGLSGTDFDKEFLLATVRGHRQDLQVLRTEGTQTTDPGIKDVVDKGEKLVILHLRAAYKLAVATGVQLPPRPAPAP